MYITNQWTIESNNIMNELVTVLLPTYNGQQYIRQMLDSIYLQDYRPIEIIISDDASVDRTIPVINSWVKDKCSEDFLCKIVKNKRNMGLSGNISNAVKYIHGKYLFLADQDDLWKKNKISAQVDYLNKNIDCEMCICDRSAIDKNNKTICKSLMHYDNINFQKRDYKEVLNNGSEYPANSICLRTEHLDSIFPIPVKICEHDTFIAIMAAHYGKIGYVRTPLILYRIHDNNLSGNYAMETNKNLFKLGCITIKTLKRINKRNATDIAIIKEELKRRFDEEGTMFSMKLNSSEIKNIYIASLKYILDNMYKWKRFV